MIRRSVLAAALAVAPLVYGTRVVAQQPGQPAQPAQTRAAQSAAAGKWDVEQSLGPSKVIRFETSEGTWLNLDVSPDGRTLVFDLLGDLYTLPIEGGRATRVTSGAAFDFHPRFTPDGRSLSFISDRDGAQNVWLADLDGRSPRQLTKENQREVNSPSWSPDGEYVFVRKHFVSTRSLGGGEIWMYHRSGGAGLQVTDRVSFQKDQGEPAVSADGRYLYYSQDVTPGQTFEYNKDPYAGIYAIFRRDLTTGETRRVTGGPGGAITPRPSPDGKLLSFIRRNRLQTELWLRDLDTGEEWSVWHGLERDMQEAWAIHGVYAQYAWTPDSRAIVIWAQGGFWRVDVAAKEAARIPFTAEVEQRIHEGVRYAVDVAPDTFRVRMLRHVVTSPDGRLVAYDALGHIWIRALPGGTPRRLTRDDAHLELAPAFSPDGRSIAFATWSDAEGGRIRVARISDGRATDVVRTRGHYTEPAWSPDGSRIVFRATGDDYIRGQGFGENPGIFVVNADGTGTPERVRRDGASPRFDHTGRRIYVLAGGGAGTRLLSSELDGTDEVVHFESENADQIVPSPDGEWVAFTERYKAYVARFPRTGRTVRIGPDVGAFPVAAISRDAGANLHWSGDGERIHWTLGPEYFTRELGRSFVWLNAPGDTTPALAPETSGLDISFTARSDQPSGTIALTNARIITMAGRGWSSPGGWQGEPASYRPAVTGSAAQGVIENGTLVIEGNRIVAIGPSAAVRPPAGAQVIDATGRTIMPGIVDVHAHVGGEGSGILAQASWPLMANLAFGVTTSHDPSNDTETVFSNIELVRTGAKLGPRLFSTGTILYGAETPFKAVVNSYEDALAHLRRQQAVGAFSVKSYNQRRRDARQMIIKAARELEMMVVPEGGSLWFNNASMVLDGHTGVEHSLPVPNVYQDAERLFGESSTGYTPTLIVGYGGLSGEYYFYERSNVWENEQLLAFTPRGSVDARSRRRLMAAGDDDFNHILIARGAKEIADRGGLVTLGAHGQLQGLGAHWELWMLAQGGMTSMEALAAATIDGARYLGLDRDIGSLEVGKLADLVVLTANPLDDIRNTDDIAQVMVNGRLYDARTLHQLAPTAKERLPLPWERARNGLR